jgi:indole-3-glycerol phosphate synthase
MARITALALSFLATSSCIEAFAPAHNHHRQQPAAASTSTSLEAIGVFVRKAKEADVRQYCQDGPSDSVLAVLQQIKDGRGTAEASSATGPLQTALTKRKGTISIIPEYKRNQEGSGYLSSIPPPRILSPVFREFGATAVAVLTDERTGGCTYDDLVDVVEEQQEAMGEVPGPLPVICSDLIVDEIQIARAKDAGAAAIVVTYNVVGGEKVAQFIKDAKIVGMETIVQISNAEEAQGAVEAGASILSVVGVAGADAKYSVIENVVSSSSSNDDDDDTARPICTIANILAKDNKALEEVEEAWMCRDKGFNCVWVSDALYKSGNDPVEHPGAIISSMRAKSSVKYASPKARSGKGEGAREYLGDILM